MILRCTPNISKSRPRKCRGESHYTKVLILCALLWHHVKVTGPQKRLVANSATFCATLIVHRSEPATISLITDSFSWVLLTFPSARMSRAETLQGSVHFAFDKHVPTRRRRRAVSLAAKRPRSQVDALSYYVHLNLLSGAKEAILPLPCRHVHCSVPAKQLCGDCSISMTPQLARTISRLIFGKNIIYRKHRSWYAELLQEI